MTFFCKIIISINFIKKLVIFRNFWLWPCIFSFKSHIHLQTLYTIYISHKPLPNFLGFYLSSHFTETMATRSLSRVFSRSLTCFSIKSPSLHRSTISRIRPIAAVVNTFRQISPGATIARGLATRQTTSSLNDSSPNWSNRPPKETILLDGCDFEHWLVVVEKPDENLTRDDIIAGYIKTLASVIGRYIVKP